jgi:hypothetical protein
VGGCFRARPILQQAEAVSRRRHRMRARRERERRDYQTQDMFIETLDAQFLADLPPHFVLLGLDEVTGEMRPGVATVWKDEIARRAARIEHELIFGDGQQTPPPRGIFG